MSRRTMAALDACALVTALRRRDEPQVRGILASTDTAGVARILAEWLPAAVHSQGMMIENFIGILIDQEIHERHRS